MFTRRTTLSKFLIEQLKGSKESNDLAALLVDVAAAIKAISAVAAKGALEGNTGSLETVNVQGETQKPLDVLTNEIMLRHCDWGGLVAGMASEEMEEPFAIPAEYERGRYLLLFDPLDGSSNIDLNVAVGTIFSVLVHDSAQPPQLQDFLQIGKKQVAAGYAIYGPSTLLVLTVGRGTHGFTLDREIGNFILTHPNLSVPNETMSSTVSRCLANFRTVSDGPSIASGGITAFTREPSARRASTIGDDSSMRRPTADTILSITWRRRASESKRSSVRYRRPARST